MENIPRFEQFMTFTGGLFLAASAALLLMPGPIWIVLGAKLVTPQTAFLIRAQTPWLMTMAILAIMLRDRDESDPDARAFLFALLAGSSLGLLMALYAVFAGIVNGLGWFVVAPFLAFALLSALYLREG